MTALSIFPQKQYLTMLPIDAPKSLLRDLKNHDKLTTISLVGGLLTEPKYAANNCRLELLANLTCTYCSGKKVVRRQKLEKWINHDLQKTMAISYEDPLEDIFIGNVINEYGNNRIYLGLWPNADFYTQQILIAAAQGDDPLLPVETRTEINSLLKLSELIASHNKHDRYIEGINSPKTDLVLPSEHRFREIASRVVFNVKELEEYGIPYQNLFPFFLAREEIIGIRKQTTDSSELLKKPLLFLKDLVIVPIPSAISIAVRLHILSHFYNSGDIHAFSEKLNEVQIFFVNSYILSKLDVQNIYNIRIRKDNSFSDFFSDFYCKFDIDKIAHLIIIHDNLKEVLEKGYNEWRTFNDQEIQSFEKHIFDNVEFLKREYRCNTGITIVIFAGIGRGSSLGIKSIPNDWQVTFFDIADFYHFAHTRNVSLLRLWKFNRSLTSIKNNNIQFIDLGGTFNSYCFWRKQNGNFISKDMDYPGVNLLNIMSDFVVEGKKESRLDYDNHGVRIGKPARIEEVQRLNPQPFFKELERKPIYGSLRSISRGMLTGVVETKFRPYWLLCTQELQNPNSSATLYQLWEAILLWLGSLAFELDDYLKFIGKEPFHISFIFRDIETWLDALPDRKSEIAPKINASKNMFQIEIIVPNDFPSLLIWPKNVAERALCEYIVIGVSKFIEGFGQEPINANIIEDLIGKIFKNPNARRIHFFWIDRGIDLIEYRSSLPEGFRFIQEEDESQTKLGIAWKVISHDGLKEIKGKEKCLEFLNNLVDIIWADLKEIMKRYDPKLIITTALTNIERVQRDERHWGRTALALISLDKSKSDAMEKAQLRESQRTRASLTNRVLIEMAICNENTNNHIFGKAEFDDLCGRIITLIEYAYFSDAINFELVPDIIEINPNGTIQFDIENLNRIVKAYTEVMFSDIFKGKAEQYYSLYKKPKNAVDNIEDSYSTEFIKAFEAEYGVKLKSYLEIAAEFLEIAIENGTHIVEINIMDAINRISRKRNISVNEINNFISAFSLESRSEWDKIPSGYNLRDIYPWKYRRRLSLISKPLIKYQNHQELLLIYGLRQLYQSFGYILWNIEQGWFPIDYFSSCKMKAFIGNIAEEKGREFEEKVCEQFLTLNWAAEANVPMKCLGASKKYGDIDVLAWSSDKNVILAIECKRLKPAKTIGEIGEQLREFHGIDRDRLHKHLERVNWLQDNSNLLKKFIGINEGKIRIFPMLVANYLLPIKFRDNLPMPNELVIQIEDIKTFLYTKINTLTAD